MRRFLLLLSFLCSISSLPPAIAACGSSSDTSTTAGAGGGGVTDGALLPSDAGTDGAGATRSPIPGDPPPATGAIMVTINGERRAFDGPATWTKLSIDGGTVVGFQTNARAASKWTLLLAVFGNTPGTYDCAGTDRNGGLAIFDDSDPDAGGDRLSYGGTVVTSSARSPSRAMARRRAIM